MQSRAALQSLREMHTDEPSPPASTLQPITKAKDAARAVMQEPGPLLTLGHPSTLRPEARVSLPQPMHGMTISLPLSAIARRTSSVSPWVHASYLALRIELRWALRDRSLRTVLDEIDLRWQPSRPRRLHDVVHALERLERVVTRVRFVPNTCLFRSLGRYALLRHAGLEPRLFLGLHPDSSEMDGHAWVEVCGQPVLEAAPPEYVVTFEHAGPT